MPGLAQKERRKHRGRSRSCTTLFLPQGVEIELIFTLRAAVSETQANFQNCHFWAWNLAISKCSEVGHILVLSFYLSRSKLSLFLLYGQRFPRYWPFFSKLPYLGINLAAGKSSKVAHTPLSTQLGRNWGYFRSMVSGFQEILIYLYIKIYLCPR